MIVTVLAASLLLSGSQSQRQDLPRYPVRDANYWKWRELPWTVVDSEISQKRRQLDELADKGSSYLPQIEKIALDAQKKFEAAPKPDARQLIIWTYAAFRAQRLDPSSSRRLNAVTANRYMEVTKPIASYEYARARFLVMSDIFYDKYVSVGKRLLKKEYNDYWVRFYYTRLMNSLSNTSEAKRLCGELLRDWPNKNSVVALTGDTYYLASFNKISKPDLLQAKKYYETFLQKAPSSDSYIAIVKWRLKNIEKKLSGG